MILLVFIFVLTIAFAALSQHRALAQLAVVDDPVTGVRRSIPKALVGKEKTSAYGFAWTLNRGDLRIDTLLFPAERTLHALQD